MSARTRDRERHSQNDIRKGFSASIASTYRPTTRHRTAIAAAAHSDTNRNNVAHNKSRPNPLRRALLTRPQHANAMQHAMQPQNSRSFHEAQTKAPPGTIWSGEIANT